MAGPQMWPAALPRQIRESSLRAAEVKVYDLLAGSLGSGWVVFYSRPWLGMTPSGEEKDGECDFVVSPGDFMCPLDRRHPYRPRSSQDPGSEVSSHIRSFELSLQ